MTIAALVESLKRAWEDDLCLRGLLPQVRQDGVTIYLPPSAMAVPRQHIECMTAETLRGSGDLLSLLDRVFVFGLRSGYHLHEIVELQELVGDEEPPPLCHLCSERL
mgnify:FL=1